MTTPAISPQPARVLGSIDATCVVIGAIIGVGIFFNPSDVAKLCPSTTLAIVAWGIGGVIALCGALAFAELGGMYHGTGAIYTIIRDCYGPYPAFLFVFCMATIIVPGAVGVMAVICADNILVVIGMEVGTHSKTPLVIAVALIVALMIANMIGVRWGSRIQNLTVFAKVAALLAIVTLAIFLAPALKAIEPAVIDAAAVTPPKPGVIVGLLGALVFAMFAFGGWQQVLWMAGEVREPRKVLPRAIIIGVVIVIVVYLLANWAYLRLLGVQGVAESKALAADAVGVVWPNWGRRLAAAAVAVSAFGVLNVNVLTAPRLILGMAQDGRFLNVFAHMSVRFGTPVAAIGILAAIAIALLIAVGADAVDKLVTATVVVDSVFFVLTGAAVLVLRRKRPHADRPMRVPWYPIVPLLFVIGEIGAILGGYLNPNVQMTAMVSTGWIAFASAVYWIWFKTPRPIHSG